MRKFNFIVIPDIPTLKPSFHMTRRQAWARIKANQRDWGQHQTTVKAVEPETNKLRVVWIGIA